MLRAEEQEKFGKAQEEYQKKLAEVDEAVKKEEEKRAEEAKKKEIEATAAKEAKRRLAEQEARKKRSLATLFKEEVADPVAGAGEGLKDMLIGGGKYR
jgi:predicted transcriptional regulator